MSMSSCRWMGRCHISMSSCRHVTWMLSHASCRWMMSMDDVTCIMSMDGTLSHASCRCRPVVLSSCRCRHVMSVTECSPKPPQPTGVAVWGSIPSPFASAIPTADWMRASVCSCGRLQSAVCRLQTGRDEICGRRVCSCRPVLIWVYLTSRPAIGIYLPESPHGVVLCPETQCGIYYAIMRSSWTNINMTQLCSMPWNNTVRVSQILYASLARDLLSQIHK